MNIPSTFMMLGHKWTVEIIAKDDWPNDLDEVGSTDFARCKITILEGPVGYMQQTFLHELLHAALKYMGRARLDKDEEFIDLLAGFMHQALVTGE